MERTLEAKEAGLDRVELPNVDEIQALEKIAAEKKREQINLRNEYNELNTQVAVTKDRLGS